jgi:hypothetical protein
MTLPLYRIYEIYEKYFTNASNYLIGMTIYHLEIIFLLGYLGLNLNTHVWLPMITPDKAGDINFLNYHVGFNALSIWWTLAILVIDFTFLYIIKHEIKNYEITHYKRLLPTIFNYNITLNKKEIIIIECIIFYLSIGNPIMRGALYSLSFNTIQIYIVYRILFTNYFGQYLKPIFIFACYFSILYLIAQPIYELIRLKILIG